MSAAYWITLGVFLPIALVAIGAHYLGRASNPASKAASMIARLVAGAFLWTMAALILYMVWDIVTGMGTPFMLFLIAVALFLILIQSGRRARY